MPAAHPKVKTLTKREVVDRLSRRSIASKKQAEEILNLALEAICSTLREGGKVQLISFGTFGTRLRKARQARNPRTGQPLILPLIRVPFFRPGKLLRQAVK